MELEIGSFILFSTLLALAPGPDNTFILVQSMRYGARKGLYIVFGLVLGCAVHTTWVVLGVATLTERIPSIAVILKVFGSLYMLYLVYLLLTQDNGPELGEQEAKKGSDFFMLRTGFLMNVLNPKVGIFFLSFFPGFLFSDTLSTYIQFIALGLIFMAVTLLVFGSIAIGGSRLSKWFRVERWSSGFRYVQIGVFLLVVVFLWLE